VLAGVGYHQIPLTGGEPPPLSRRTAERTQHSPTRQEEIRSVRPLHNSSNLPSTRQGSEETAVPGAKICSCGRSMARKYFV